MRNFPHFGYCTRIPYSFIKSFNEMLTFRNFPFQMNVINSVKMSPAWFCNNINTNDPWLQRSAQIVTPTLAKVQRLPTPKVQPKLIISQCPYRGKAFFGINKNDLKFQNCLALPGPAEEFRKLYNYIPPLVLPKFQICENCST